MKIDIEKAIENLQAIVDLGLDVGEDMEAEKLGIKVLREKQYKEQLENSTKKILGKAICLYGIEMQLTVAVEEFSELQKELCKAVRGKAVIENIKEEIADVEIMLKQIKMIFNISEDDISIQKARKLQRLEENIERT